MNIHIFKLPSLFVFLCGACFIFKFVMIVCYTWVEDLTGDVILGKLMDKFNFILFYFVIIWRYFYSISCREVYFEILLWMWMYWD